MGILSKDQRKVVFFFLVSHEFDGEKIYTELRC